MTTAELAARIGVDPTALLELLRESEAAGIVEPSPSGWRVTASAELRHGAALRGLSWPSDDRTRPAGRGGIRDPLDEAA